MDFSMTKPQVFIVVEQFPLGAVYWYFNLDRRANEAGNIEDFRDLSDEKPGVARELSYFVKQSQVLFPVNSKFGPLFSKGCTIGGGYLKMCVFGVCLAVPTFRI